MGIKLRFLDKIAKKRDVLLVNLEFISIFFHDLEKLMHINAAFISKILPQSFIQGFFPHDANFSVDTRTLQQGDIFIALKGDHVDGHDFLDQAIEKGASGFMLSASEQTALMKKYKKEFNNKAVLFVPDTMQALIQLAHAWRSQFSYPVVAITGSVGKTTTKEMVRNILKQTDLKHIVSSGNQNTLIGVSINILKMKPEHQVAVFELGIAQVASMKKLAALLRPTYAVITYVGHSHMQGLKTLATVVHEKREVFSTFTQSSIGIINGDQPELAKISYIHPVIRFGKKTTNQIQARKIVCKNNAISFIAKIYQKKYPVLLQTCSQVRVMNALAAISVGKLLQIPDEVLIQGIQEPVVVQGRFQVLPHESGSVLIHDAYNSNPESVKASLQAFDQYKTSLKKIIVLGDMMELGEESIFWHRQMGRMICKLSNIFCVVLIGKHVEVTKKTLPIGVKSYSFENIEEAQNVLKNMLLEKDKICLFKASNSMRFDQLVQYLQKV